LKFNDLVALRRILYFRALRPCLMSTSPHASNYTLPPVQYAKSLSRRLKGLRKLGVLSDLGPEEENEVNQRAEP
jgi:hypothetical protein